MCFSGSDPHFFEQMINDASAEALSHVETGLVIYKAVGHEWHRSGSVRHRSLESITLDDGVTERVKQDMQEFLASGRW